MMLMVRVIMMLKKPSHEEDPITDVEDNIEGGEDTEEEEVLSGHFYFVLRKKLFYILAGLKGTVKAN